MRTLLSVLSLNQPRRLHEREGLKVAIVPLVARRWHLPVKIVSAKLFPRTDGGENVSTLTTKLQLRSNIWLSSGDFLLLNVLDLGVFFLLLTCVPRLPPLFVCLSSQLYMDLSGSLLFAK